MKKVFALFILVVVLSVTSVSAKDVVLTLKFNMDVDFKPFVTEYRVYTEVPGSGTKHLLQTIPTTAGDTVVLDTADLRPGKITLIYVSAVYDPGVEALSDSHEFRYIGKPVILDVYK